jgi:hypothetical protein
MKQTKRRQVFRMMGMTMTIAPLQILGRRTRIPYFLVNMSRGVM